MVMLAAEPPPDYIVAATSLDLTTMTPQGIVTVR
jgi:hypothetical protein